MYQSFHSQIIPHGHHKFPMSAVYTLLRVRFMSMKHFLLIKEDLVLCVLTSFKALWLVTVQGKLKITFLSNVSMRFILTSL